MRELSRYFIALRQEESAETTRREEASMARRRALDFVTELENWLRASGYHAQTATLNITAFGQVLLTCEPEVIRHIRDHESPSVAAAIAAIRPAPVPQEGFARGIFMSALNPLPPLVPTTTSHTTSDDWREARMGWGR